MFLIVSDYLAEGVDLTGIDVLETDRRFMRQARKEVETQGQKMLEQGLDTQVGGHMAGHVTRSYGGEMWPGMFRLIRKLLWTFPRDRQTGDHSPMSLERLAWRSGHERPRKLANQAKHRLW